jgi:hypothetical protein
VTTTGDIHPTSEQIVSVTNALRGLPLADGLPGNQYASLRLTRDDVAVLQWALGVAHGTLLDEGARCLEGATCKAWAMLIDSGLQARGLLPLSPERRATLERVDPVTLEAMATLVLRPVMRDVKRRREG